MTAVANGQDTQDKVRAIMEHLSAGGTIGQIHNITEQELEAMYAVGYNLFAARKYDQAINIFKFLCLNDHMEPRWYYSLGVAQQNKGAYQEALNAFGMATLLDMRDPRPQAQAGYCLMAIQKWPEARSALEGAIIACGDDAAHAAVKAQAEALLETVMSNTTTGTDKA
jgi:type III secretion system low calcium response chaperone LcrH/SycD